MLRKGGQRLAQQPKSHAAVRVRAGIATHKKDCTDESLRNIRAIFVYKSTTHNSAEGGHSSIIRRIARLRLRAK